MRLSGTKTGSANQYNGLGDQLYDLGGARPTLDLNFSSNESLVDSVTGKTLVDHTRQSSATYVDGDGVIKTAVTNLLLQSEDFSTTWTTTDLTVSANTTTAPDGKLTADTLTIGAGVAAVMPAQAVTLANSTTYTVSIYINSSQTCDVIRFRCTVGGSAYFTVSTKTWSDLGSGWTGGTYQELNGGWIRASIQFVAGPTDGGSRSFSFGGVTAAGGTTPDTGNTLIYWGAQLEQSSTVGQYVKTTTAINSAPRFDHDPTTGESLGLLVEESRTNLALQSEDFGTTWTTTNYVLTANAIASPSGATTADKLARDTVDASVQVTQNVTCVANTAYTFSCFVKAAEWSKVGLREGSATGSYVTFDLSTATVISTNVATGTITPFPNGWYRVTMQMTTGAAQTTYGCRIIPLPDTYTSGNPLFSFAGDGTSGIYIWGAQLEAGSFPTSYIPTEGSTVTRAADVTSIEGNDFGTFNLLQYSEEFEEWNKINSQVTPNQAVAPDGTMSADFVSAVTTGTVRISNPTTVTAGTDYTASIYLKAGTETTCFWREDAEDALSGTVDLSASTINVTGGSGTITDAGNGWYRVTLTGSVSGSNFAPEIRMTSASGGIYVWGAQLEESSTATPYVKSDVTFTSRGSTATYYDYNGIIQTAAVDEARNVAFLPDGSGNFVSAGELLLEDTGTNLLTYSQDFTDPIWPTSSTATITTSTGIDDPQGTNTAATITNNSGPNLHRLIFGTAGTPYTYSVWLRRRSGSGPIYLTVGDAINQVVTVENTWTRVSATNTPTSTVVRAYVVIGSTGDSVDIWGAQLEQNPYATSYIPTTGSTATRAADVSTSAATFGNSWYEQDEGTVFTDTVNRETYPGVNVFPYILQIDDGTNNNRISYDNSVLSGGYRYNLPCHSGGVSQGEINQSGFASGAARWASAFRTNDFALAINLSPSVVSTKTSGTLPNVMTRLRIGTGFGKQFSGTIRRLTYWPTRLSNDTLQTITT